MLKAIEGKITWLQAADILGYTSRHMRRLRKGFEEYGYDGLQDRRGRTPRRTKIGIEVIQKICRLRREKYGEYSVQHFYEVATEKHGIEIGYTWLKRILQEAGLAEKAAGRGQYRRKRERRPMAGMMLHLDGSTHQWLSGQPKRDLIIMLDDADGRILHGQFVEQEGTISTLRAVEKVLKGYGRFCELYTDRGSHFCNTTHAEVGPDAEQKGQVPRVLKALGIRQILARSPQARGRSERAFGTIQGRLPQELKTAGITTYAQANAYLEQIFLPDFNRRFTVLPAQKESAFVPLVGIDLSLLLSVQHERTVRNDSTILFNNIILQLPTTKERLHYVRCPVLVHQLLDGNLGVSYQGRLLATYTSDGELIANPAVGSKKSQATRAEEITEGYGYCWTGDNLKRLPPVLGPPADRLPTVSTASAAVGAACAFSESEDTSNRTEQKTADIFECL